MSLFQKPSELQPKYALSALIYGSPGSGKTTLACSAPNAVLLDFDEGATRVHGAHRVPTLVVKSWQQVVEAVDELRQSPDVHSVVVDTVAKLLFRMDEFIMARNPKMRKSDGTLSLQGYGIRKQMFIDFIKSLTMIGKHVFFVAHDKEEKHGEDYVARPEIGGSSAGDLMKELDLVGYMELIGEERTIAFDPNERYYGKNSCGMAGKVKLPKLLDNKGELTGNNDFMARVTTAYQQRQMESIKKSGDFEQLCDMIAERVATIENAKDANDFVAWVGGLQHIYNSKVVAQTKFAAKVTELGLIFNKSEKTYSDPEKND